MNKASQWAGNSDYCQNCGKVLQETTLEGFSVICPHCKGIC